VKVLLDTDSALFESIENTNIIKSTIKPGLVVNLELAIKIKEDRLSIWGNILKPLIVDINGLQSIEDEARDYWATKESMQFIQSVAIVTNKKVQVMIANFYILFSKPVVPSKLFTNFNDALEWSKKFI
jgi:hypothetical protein